MLRKRFSSLLHKYRLSFFPPTYIYIYIWQGSPFLLAYLYSLRPPPFPPPWFYETQSVIGGREGSMGLRVIEREQGRRMWMEH